MKKEKYIGLGASVVLLAAGIVGSVLARSRAVAEGASDSAKLIFACCLIGALVGLVAAVLTALRLNKPATTEKREDTQRLALAAMFAALCYIGFSYLKIPMGPGNPAFHLGNVFCVLGALLMGGVWGGMAGAVGMTVADLTTGYVTSAPKTFLLKLCIGLIVGLVAHKGFHISEEEDSKKVFLGAGLASLAGMAFNIVADPLVGYFYKMWILGISQEIATVLAKLSALTTFVNAIIAIVVATVFYVALRPALKKARMFPRIG